jgi:hypothetical protein
MHISYPQAFEDIANDDYAPSWGIQGEMDQFCA